MKNIEIKYNEWLIKLLIITGLGCSVLYSTQLFEGAKSAKQFGFIMVVCLMLFFVTIRTLGTKKNRIISLSISDILLLLYAVWALIRLLTSDADSIHNLYFWEFSATVVWYFWLRSFFRASDDNERFNYVFYFLILLGYVQLTVCVLQLTGTIPSFSHIFLVSGTFRNTSELCIYLTCILPVAVSAGLKASETTSTGKLIRAVCFFYILCWLGFVLAFGSRTALLAGLVGMVVFTGFQTGVFKYFKGKIRKILVLSILLFVAYGLAFLLAQYKQDSASGRLLMWKVAWSGIKEAPFQGHGFNAFQARYMQFQAAYFQKHVGNEKEIMIADNMNAALNDYIETGFNLGIIGFLLFLGFWISVSTHVIADLIRNPPKAKEIAGQACKDERYCFDLVSVTVLVIFLVSSGFYFVEKMLPIKIIALFFAACAASNTKNIFSFQIRQLALKPIAVIVPVFCCFVGYSTVNNIKHYAHWEKANSLNQFGYVKEAGAEYERIYPYLRHNGQFLYSYARNLYENEAYQKCLEYMEMAKPKIATNSFYDLFGDACHKTGDYKNAIICYEYTAFMVPNRFRPLYKLFNLYEEIGETQSALDLAQIIVNKPIKVDSYEIREIIKECLNFIKLKEYEQKIVVN